MLNTSPKKIGIPKETKIGETRVSLTPEAVEVLVAAGHEVSIESAAGIKASFSDNDYSAVGARVVTNPTELWNESELIVKVKEPQVTEYKYLRPDLTLVSYLHLAGEPTLTAAMLESKIDSFAYELYQDSSMQLPLLKPMSQIAGRLSIVLGSNLLLASSGGRGLLLAGASGVKKGKVVIVGGGTAGRAALELALGQGAEVVLFEKSIKVIEQIEAQYGSRVQLLSASSKQLLNELSDADLLIGSVLIPGAKAPRIISSEHIKSMPTGSVFIDISIDQGGCSETSRVTTHESPTYIQEGVIHYCVCNIPALAPRTATLSLSNAILPFILEICSCFGSWNSTVLAAMCTKKGEIPHPTVKASV